MLHNYRVRAAAEADLAEIAKTEALCFSDPWSEASLASHMAGDGGILLICEGEDGALGYLSARALPPECEIYRVATLPAHRRCGVGSALLAALFETAAGVNSFFLEVRENNTPAISLYKAHGFTELARRKNYYRNPKEDALILGKEQM